MVTEISFPSSSDLRGQFLKPFSKKLLPDFDVQECFFSHSTRGVLRGMHFQLPPFEQDKLVVCLSGRVLDVALDLRNGSLYSTELSADQPRALFIPKGFAHGFYALDDALLGYWVNSSYSAEHDQGIRWDSFGFNWPLKRPVLSERDKRLPKLSEFVSPF